MDPVFFRPDIHHQMRPMVGYIGVYAVYWAHILGYYSDVTRTVPHNERSAYYHTFSSFKQQLHSFRAFFLSSAQSTLYRVNYCNSLLLATGVWAQKNQYETHSSPLWCRGAILPARYMGNTLVVHHVMNPFFLWVVRK